MKNTTPRSRRSSRPLPLVAEVCLYGTDRVGHGYISAFPVADGITPHSTLLGDGTPRPGVGATEALWMALDALVKAGVLSGRVGVYAPGGEFYAEIRDIGGNWSYYGDLNWEPAKVYVLA